MKKVFFILGLFSLTMTTLVYAHPPKDIQISYDTVTKILKAVIIHEVSNVDKHYISKVDIGLNGKEIISQAISRQDNNENQTVSYYIPDAKAGDELSVEGYCSISGKLEKEVKVSGK